MSPRMYENGADKQRAYRDRLRERGLVVAGPRPANPKPPSRPARLVAIETELRALAAEYQRWQDTLPANLAESQQAEQLAEITETLEAIADDVADLEPPRIGRSNHAK